MKAIIQHNFTSGLGDFVSDVSHYMTILNEVKKLGYEIHLKISLRSNKYVRTPFFKILFDENTINFFDSISETNNTHYELDIDGCKYYGSNHHPQIPGQHHFDIFFDQVPDNFQFNVFDAQRIHLENKIPSVIPKPNETILEKVNLFWDKNPEDYNFLHIRTSDIIDGNNDRYDRIINNIRNYIKETNEYYHLGTNNKYIYKILKEEPNVFTYEFDNYDVVNNDMNAFTNGLYYGNLDDNILEDRLRNIFAEMVSIRKSKKIIFAYDISWISNFLFYPLSVSNNKIELINKNGWVV